MNAQIDPLDEIQEEEKASVSSTVSDQKYNENVLGSPVFSPGMKFMGLRLNENLNELNSSSVDNSKDPNTKSTEDGICRTSEKLKEYASPDLFDQVECKKIVENNG